LYLLIYVNASLDAIHEVADSVRPTAWTSEVYLASAFRCGDRRRVESVSRSIKLQWRSPYLFQRSWARTWASLKCCGPPRARCSPVAHATR